MQRACEVRAQAQAFFDSPTGLRRLVLFRFSSVLFFFFPHLILSVRGHVLALDEVKYSPAVKRTLRERTCILPSTAL